MAFNLARYDLMPFNIGEGATVFISASGSERITPSIGTASEIYISSAYGSERVTQQVTAVSGHFIEGAGGFETIDELVTKGEFYILLKPRFAETVGEEVEPSANVKATVRGNEAVTYDLTPAADLYFSVRSNENISSETQIDAEIWVTNGGYELVSESASVIALDQRTCYLTVTLHPGQKLIVNAESYTVLLDGENAIELQSGDWIDELDRETTDITIFAASGIANLSASIVYTERYL